MMAEEEWLPVPGYEGYYVVSNLGRVRSIDRTNHLGWKYSGRMLSAATHHKGYKYVVMCRDGEPRTFQVTRLVLEAFVGPPPSEDHQAHHANGDAGDDRLANLSWGTSKQGMQNRVRRGTRLPSICRNGHPYDEANTYVSPTGARHCRACWRAKEKRKYYKNKEKV